MGEAFSLPPRVQRTPGTPQARPLLRRALALAASLVLVASLWWTRTGGSVPGDLLLGAGGDVALQVGSKRSIVHDVTPLQEGYGLTTFEAPSVVFVGKSSTLRLGPNSEARITQVQHQGARLEVAVRLERGALWVDESAETRCTVATRDSLIVPTGTSFEAQVGEPGTRVSVWHGSVEVAARPSSSAPVGSASAATPAGGGATASGTASPSTGRTAAQASSVRLEAGQLAFVQAREARVEAQPFDRSQVAQQSWFSFNTRLQPSRPQVQQALSPPVLQATPETRLFERGQAPGSIPASDARVVLPGLTPKDLPSSSVLPNASLPPAPRASEPSTSVPALYPAGSPPDGDGQRRGEPPQPGTGPDASALTRAPRGAEAGQPRGTGPAEPPGNSQPPAPPSGPAERPVRPASERPGGDGIPVLRTRASDVPGQRQGMPGAGSQAHPPEAGGRPQDPSRYQQPLPGMPGDDSLRQRPQGQGERAPWEERRQQGGGPRQQGQERPPQGEDAQRRGAPGQGERAPWEDRRQQGEDPRRQGQEPPSNAEPPTRPGGEGQAPGGSGDGPRPPWQGRQEQPPSGGGPQGPEQRGGDRPNQGGGGLGPPPGGPFQGGGPLQGGGPFQGGGGGPRGRGPRR